MDVLKNIFRKGSVGTYFTSLWSYMIYNLINPQKEFKKSSGTQEKKSLGLRLNTQMWL